MSDSGEREKRIFVTDCSNNKQTRYFSLRRTRGKGKKQKKGWMKSNHIFSSKSDLCENPKAEAPKESFGSQEIVHIRLALCLAERP